MSQITQILLLLFCEIRVISEKQKNDSYGKIKEHQRTLRGKRL